MANKKRRKQNRHRNAQARSATATTTAERPVSDRTKSVARASMELGSRGTMHLETLSAIPVDDFIAAL